jgi:large subunit ribosomal protein L21
MADQAIIKQGNQQFLVRPGSRIVVNRLSAEEGQELKTANLLDQSPVMLRVVKHQRGPKIHGLKFKNKVRYLRRYGHRQEQTVVEVIDLGQLKAAPIKPAVAKAVAKPKPVRRPTATAKRSSAKTDAKA